MISELIPLIVWALCVACVVIGFIGTIVPILPGPPLILAGVLGIAWWEDFTKVGIVPVTIIGALAVLTIIIDFVSSYIGAKKVGASKAALVGSIIGSIVGIFFLLPGLILGPFFGALAGEWLSSRNVSQATRVGVGTWIGMLVGTAAKLGLSLAMIAVFILALLA
jgi:uncharacterized protein YqgC (DUF456 family)